MNLFRKFKTMADMEEKFTSDPIDTARKDGYAWVLKPTRTCDNFLFK